MVVINYYSDLAIHQCTFDQHEICPQMMYPGLSVNLDFDPIGLCAWLCKISAFISYFIFHLKNPLPKILCSPRFSRACHKRTTLAHLLHCIGGHCLWETEVREQWKWGRQWRREHICGWYWMAIALGQVQLTSGSFRIFLWSPYWIALHNSPSGKRKGEELTYQRPLVLRLFSQNSSLK